MSPHSAQHVQSVNPSVMWAWPHHVSWTKAKRQPLWNLYLQRNCLFAIWLWNQNKRSTKDYKSTKFCWSEKLLCYLLSSMIYQEYGLHAELSMLLLPQYFASTWMSTAGKPSATVHGSLAICLSHKRVLCVPGIAPNLGVFNASNVSIRFNIFQLLWPSFTLDKCNQEQHGTTIITPVTCCEVFPHVQTFCPEVHFVSNIHIMFLQCLATEDSRQSGAPAQPGAL